MVEAMYLDNKIMKLSIIIALKKYICHSQPQHQLLLSPLSYITVKKKALLYQIHLHWLHIPI